MIDRLPPQSLEAEQSVLGAILIDRDAVVEVAEFLRPEDFYRQANGAIFSAILELFERREPIDIVTVSETLERSDQLETIGGRAYLSSLSNSTPTAVHPCWASHSTVVPVPHPRSSARPGRIAEVCSTTSRGVTPVSHGVRPRRYARSKERPLGAIRCRRRTCRRRSDRRSRNRSGAR